MEALKRFYEPEKIHDPELILTVGALGLVVNLLGKERISLLISYGLHAKKIFISPMVCPLLNHIFCFKGLCLFHEHGGHGHSHGHTQDRGTHSHISALANRYVCCHCKTKPAVVINRHFNL